MARIVFLGYGEYGAATLRGLIINHDVVLVCTHPTPPDRGNPVEVLARTTEISVHHSRDLADADEVAFLHTLNPEFLVSTNWRRRVPDAVLACPSRAALNVHDSLLPHYAGLSAEHWVLRNGEERTGVTVHLMTSLMDAGGIVYQREVPIDVEDRADDIVRKQLAIYPEIIIEAIAAFSQPDFESIVYSPSAYERYHSITDADLRIKWSVGPTTILNMARAHSDPYPNCFFQFRSKRLRLKAARWPECSYRGTPGRVVTHVDDGVAVATGLDHSGMSISGIVLQSVQDIDNEIHNPKYILPRNAQLK